MAEERAAPRATLAAIARAAGVSVPTVSKVVNGRADVAPETRERVANLLAGHGYVARGPGGARPERRSVALVFDAMRAMNNLETLRGVLEAAADGGVDVVVDVVPDDPLGARWARRMTAGGRAGVILVTSGITGQQWRHFTEQRLPIVMIDPVNLPGPEVPSVGASNFNGGMAATEHLLELGHRRVGFIEGPPASMMSIARLHGYRAALSRAGIAADPELTIAADFSFDGGFAAATRLLAREPRPTAIFASNDLQAFGAIEAARILGLRIPEDLSIAGFDDTPAAQWSAPPLTSVRQPFAEMGRVAMRSLLRLADGGELESPRVELATRLIVRKSTARI
ncbi:LacI family DNA-binding transcriptional regulator [Actinoplanes couchii]|uniref:LacI family transcriptional regulator n=1 Tax=Actinoplanes couchii TaxID=403638 RepID=A0ABQ3XHX0_9ACTN|nr:LacI family DNA-binding transcriptional regulator [Actinoplanes couchii]MDR6317688.1 LacI family transcriptional regulator [Actinoplanes couchii]GID58073.1 LacI family transcriptional regulator [Actinoplanes couchii]